MPEFYIVIARKIVSQILGGHLRALPAPVFYAYDIKSYVLYRIVPLSMTLGDPEPVASPGFAARRGGNLSLGESKGQRGHLPPPPPPQKKKREKYFLPNIM